MQERLWLRNTLLIVGGYYLSALVVVPFWVPIAKLAEGRVYYPGWQTFLMELFNAVPVLAGAALAGPLAGYFLETNRPALWTVCLGGFVALCNWSAHHWYVKPSFSDVAVQGTKAIVSGGLAAAACSLILKRRRSTAGTGAPA